MNKRIDHYKELLQILPRNNVKNSREYMKKAVLMKEAVEAYKKELVNSIKKRYTSIVITAENEELKSLGNYLEDIKSKLYLLGKNDSYEKSSLDETLYNLKKFYNDDLVNVNKNIDTALTKFMVVGVNLTEKDFNYGTEVEEYMKVFFQEKNPESNNLKETFDKIYWKCPNLIEKIYLNFRYLFFKNKKIFEKYYDKKIKEANLNVTLINDNYKKYLDLNESDIKTIQDKFLNNILDVKEYDDSKISKLKETLVTKNLTEDEQNENILKLSHTLHEYKNYIIFKDVIEEIKKLYAEKNNNKNLTKGILKKISKCEKKIKKANRTFLKLKEEKKNNIIANNIKELKELYNEYDDAKFKEKIATELNDNSTLLDILNILNSYKINFQKILKTINPEISNNEIISEENKLQDFIIYPYNSLINNVTINDQREITTIILDKYKLMNVNLTLEQLEDVNIDNIISTVNKVLVNTYINKSNIKYSDLNNACDMKKILEKENIKIE